MEVAHSAPLPNCNGTVSNDEIDAQEDMPDWVHDVRVAIDKRIENLNERLTTQHERLMREKPRKRLIIFEKWHGELTEQLKLIEQHIFCA